MSFSKNRLQSGKCHPIENSIKLERTGKICPQSSSRYLIREEVIKWIKYEETDWVIDTCARISKYERKYRRSIQMHPK